MRKTTLVLTIGIAALCGRATAQQVTTGNRMSQGGDRFYEQTGTSWGGNWRGMQFQGLPTATPRIGGAPAGGGAGQVGARVQGNGGSVGFGAYFGHGYSSGMTSASPSVTTMNGQPGYMSDTSVSPFVIGSMPVVGGYTGPFAPVTAINPYGTPGSTVQLPTFSMFGTSSTVSVPDRGSAVLGGINRASEGQNQFGVPGLPVNRASGSGMGAASTRVGVTVHDLQAMDDALLAGAPSAPAPPVATSGARGSSAERAAVSVAEAKRLHEQEQAGKSDDAQGWYDRGLVAEQEGKTAVAKVYYQMAVRRANASEIGGLAQARLESMRRAGTPATVARREAP